MEQANPIPHTSSSFTSTTTPVFDLFPLQVSLLDVIGHSIYKYYGFYLILELLIVTLVDS